jgi:6-phosphofructokinase 1
MNAAIRAVVRTGLAKGWEVFGVRRGYAGLIAGDIIPLGARDVGRIIHQGGTMLGSARCPEFRTGEAQQRAIDHLERLQIDGLIVIGGNGSQTGAQALSDRGIKVVGIASTIDNDLYGSEITIGVATALNVALEAIDRLKVTAASHQRAFLVEVMGRDCGYLALMAALAGGADAAVIPEVDTDPEEVAAALRGAYDHGKAHAIVVVAEGARYNAEELENYFNLHRERLGFELRGTKLGHVQRGGAPDAYDRLLGTQLGAAATGQLAKGEHGVLMGMTGGRITATPLDVVVSGKKPLDVSLMDLVRELAQ